MPELSSLARFSHAPPALPLTTIFSIIFVLGLGTTIIFFVIITPIVGQQNVEKVFNQSEKINKFIQNLNIPISSPSNQPACGNQSCEAGENSSNCLQDCFVCNSNGKCESELGENVNSCPTDCKTTSGGSGGGGSGSGGSSGGGGSGGGGGGGGGGGSGGTGGEPPTPSCGDGSCNGSETCSSCPSDCGSCPPICGNNVREGIEVCDGNDLAGQTCITKGFTGGTLSCKSDCTDFNTTNCTTQQNFADHIIQYGITWTFDKPYQYGQFANGDYWVVGPVTITAITPSFDGSYHGWEVNPSNVVDQGFDARVFNFNPNLVPVLPYVANPNQSIVKTISKEVGLPNCRPCLQTAAVLTVVASVPTNNGATLFRPPYFGSQKPWYSINDLHPELLPSLLPPAHPPSLEEVRNNFSKLQLDHKYETYGGRNMHPADNMPDYGSDISVRNNDAALRLMLNDSSQAKMPALINFVQYGIDLYYIALVGNRGWPANGGHAEGRKLPIAFAAIALNNENMKNLVRNNPAFFAEDGGIYYSSTANRVLFGQTVACNPPVEYAYWRSIGIDTGSKTCPDPYGYIDGGQGPGWNYDSCCLATVWKGIAAATCTMPELKNIWNNPYLFDYADRWVTLGAWSQPDPCAPPTGICKPGSLNPGAPCTPGSAATVCGDPPNTWDYDNTKCDYSARWAQDYGVRYGAKPSNPGQCILDTDPNDGIGRFPHLQGTHKDFGFYRSVFSDEMWQLYRPGCGGNPIALFTMNPNSGPVPLTVNFDASASRDLDGNIVSYDWNFGDNSFGSGVIVQHIFSNSGTYQVLLTVRDNEGKIGTAEKWVVAQSPLEGGIVLYLTLDDLLDHSGFGHAVQCQNGCPSLVPGKRNLAMSQDGSANGPYLWIPHAANLDGMPQLTIAFWAKKNSADVGGNVVNKHVVYNVLLESNEIIPYLFNASGQRLDPRKVTSLIQNTEWHHYALTYNGTTVILYLDGQPLDNWPFSGNIGSQPSWEIAVGKNLWGNSFNGLLDDLRIYDRALSLQEIQSLYNG